MVIDLKKKKEKRSKHQVHHISLTLYSITTAYIVLLLFINFVIYFGANPGVYIGYRKSIPNVFIVLFFFVLSTNCFVEEFGCSSGKSIKGFSS